jgi:ubiquinone/menaquinone biosynthesis C-methylase UbiE
MRLILSILRPVYYLLYHHFAWTYDFVADLVSLGQWQEWVRVTLPHLQGRVLEIGFGPGHLQVDLHQEGLISFGLDESRFMARQAAGWMKKAGVPLRLARALAQSLPYPAGAFNSVVATFPAETIFDPHTLDEVHRVLTPGGVFVILPMAWITGVRPLERFTAWLMRITGATPGKPDTIPASLQDQFIVHGFDLRQELVPLPHSKVLVLVAQKC